MYKCVEYVSVCHFEDDWNKIYMKWQKKELSFLFSPSAIVLWQSDEIFWWKFQFHRHMYWRISVLIYKIFGKLSVISFITGITRRRKEEKREKGKKSASSFIYFISIFCCSSRNINTYRNYILWCLKIGLKKLQLPFSNGNK